MARLRWWSLGLLGLLWLASLVYFLHTTLNHDVAWYLVAADRFLDGARLYRDIIEVNPPLAFYLAVPPVAAARLTGWEPIDCLVVYVCLLIALSLAICDHLVEDAVGSGREWMMAARWQEWGTSREWRVSPAHRA